MYKLIIVMTAYFILLVNCYSQTTGWQSLNTGVSVDLYGLYFTNISTGYVCGESGTILKTTNGGINWNQLNSSVMFQLNDICFADSITGYCAGNSGILKTTNSGLNWFSVFNLQMNKICYADNIVFAGGQTGIYKSLDSGQTFIKILNISTGSIRGLFFQNSNTGYGMGGIAIQAKTTNGGLNWFGGSYWGPYDYYFGECYYFNSDTGFVAYFFYSGYPNYYSGYGIYKTLYWGTGGSSWIQVFSSSAKGIGGITFTGRDTGYAVGGGWTGSQNESLIIKTINGGNSWFYQDFTTNHILQDVFFLDSKKGYAVGREGTIIKTVTGGIVDIENISVKIPASYSLQQNYPNPFNPVTRIKFSIMSSPRVSGGDPVQLKVYDVTGREVQTLVNEKLQPGTYEVTFDGSNLTSGVYFYQLVSGNYKETKKLILLK